MTDKYTDLRAALDAGPTPGPWKANTSNEIGPISKEDDQSFGMVLPVCFAEFENSEANRRYIAAIRALLADYDRMRDALEKVRPVIAADHQALLDTHGNGIEISMADELGTLELYEYDGALHVIDAALAQERGGSVDN